MFGKRRVRGLEPRRVQDRQIRMIAKVVAFTLAASPAFAQTFFPPGALPDSAAIRYTRFLKAMHEPSLFELASHDRTVEAYRLLWLRDNDRPASIRFAIKPSVVSPN